MLFAILVVLLFFSAIVSGSETAFFSLSPSNVNSIKKHKTRTNGAIIKLLSMQDYLLATVLIANNLVNICIVILSNSIINKLVTFGGAPIWAFVVKVVAVTFLLLLFGEIMPKIFAAYNSLRFARFVSVPLLALKSVFKPFSYIVIHSSNRISETVAKKRDNISIDQLSNAIEITANQSDEEKQMLSGIVSFVNTEVEQIMKPRIDIISLCLSDDFEHVKQVIIDSGFSRIPVNDEDIDDIRGILYVKDLLPYIVDDKGFEWQKLLRKAYFVPEHKKINDLLEEFQTNKVHMAIVVDEYGSTQGLVSLEDILEEIVGEITDESDLPEQTSYTKIDDNNYIFDGKTHLADFEKVIGVEDDYFSDQRGDAETVAGLMLEVKRDFLRKGDSVTARDVKLTVELLDVRRIDKVRVCIKRQ